MSWHVFDTWIVVIAALTAAACALPGTFLVLRRMSMMGDAISHAVLPGIAAAFLLAGTRTSPLLFLFAAVAGVLTALASDWISRIGGVERGAAMGVVFTTLFAIGLLMIVRAADHVDLDPSCVLFGAIELAPLDMYEWAGVTAPRAAWVGAAALVGNALLLGLFYKEMRLAAFDPGLAETLGFSPGRMHFLLMVMVAVTTVAAFEAVGSIMVIAMLVVPPATTLLLTRRLWVALVVAPALGILSALLGHLGALWIPHSFGLPPTSSSGMMAACTGLLFTLAWLFGPAGLSGMRRKRQPMTPEA